MFLLLKRLYRVLFETGRAEREIYSPMIGYLQLILLVVGTQKYLAWIGSIFSALEVVPFFSMVLFSFAMVWKSGRGHSNKAAVL